MNQLAGLFLACHLATLAITGVHRSGQQGTSFPTAGELTSPQTHVKNVAISISLTLSRRLPWRYTLGSVGGLVQQFLKGIRRLVPETALRSGVDRSLPQN